VKIDFKVDNRFYAVNNIPPESTKLLRWNGKNWDEIPVILINKDKNFTYFEAASDELSTFAITTALPSGLEVSMPAPKFFMGYENYALVLIIIIIIAVGAVVAIARKPAEPPKAEPKIRPVATIICPKCSNDKAYYWTVPSKIEVEPPTKFYKCTECEYVWYERG